MIWAEPFVRHKRAETDMSPHSSPPIPVTTYGRAVVRGAKRVFLVHGAGMDQSIWTLQGRYLAFHGWNAFAVDLPGHGRAKAMEHLPDIESMADWLLSVVADTGDGPATIIGHSLGALVALEAAARAPSQVAKLALLGAAAQMPVHPALLDLAREHDPKAVELMVDWAFGMRGHIGGNPLPGGWLMGTARSLLLRGEPQVLACDLEACDLYRNGPMSASKIACPTLILIGGEDRMTPPAAGHELANLITDATTVVIEPAGHMMMVECPDATLDALKRFLD